MKIKIGIIDDELHAIETLKYDLKENFEEIIDIVFTSTNPLEGVKKIRSSKLDLLFLDVEMPGLSGIDVLELIDDMDLEVVVTTAHEEFAIQAVGTRAIAYLLKPVLPEKLDEIIQSVAKETQLEKQAVVMPGKLAVPVFDGIELIAENDIIYCKSDSNYTTLFLVANKKLVASKTLKHFTVNLPEHQFIRIHKSYLINLNYVSKYLKKDGGELLMQNGDVLPISRNNRAGILKLIQ